MLARMRRGYTREVIVKFNNFFLTIRQAYMQLIEEAQKTIPGLSISTDIITGFCGETEEEHQVSFGGEIASVFIEFSSQETLSLLEEVKFYQVFFLLTVFCISNVFWLSCFP